LKQLSQEPVDVFHAISTESYALAYALARELEVELVLNVSSLRDCKGVARFLGKAKCTGVTHYIAMSQPLVEVLQKQLKIPAEQLHLVKPAVMAEKKRACFADEKRTPTLLCLSPFQRDSHVERLIEAIKLLRDRGARVLAFVLGTGKYEDDLRRLVRTNNLSSQVIFANIRTKAGEGLPGADILVVPSAKQAIVSTTLQAMGAGLAVVTLPSPVSDFIRDGQTARVCSKPTAKALADAIEGLLRDRDQARTLASTAMEYIKTHHTLTEMAQHTAEVYRLLPLRNKTYSMVSQ